MNNKNPHTYDVVGRVLLLLGCFVRIFIFADSPLKFTSRPFDFRFECCVYTGQNDTLNFIYVLCLSLGAELCVCV